MKTAGTHPPFPTFPQPCTKAGPSLGALGVEPSCETHFGWNMQRAQCQLHLRSYNNHQAVAEHADPNHEICHWQPVLQPANCPLVVVVAIKEC